MRHFGISAVLIIALAAVAAAGVMWAINARQPPKVEARSEPVLAIRALSPAAEDYAPSLFLIGGVEARDYATLTAPVEADVIKIAAREGDFFPQNTRLLLLDQRELRYTEQSQEAALAELRADLAAVARNRRSDRRRLRETRRLLDLADKNHRRNEALLSEEAVTQTQLETSEQTLLQRRLDVSAMEKQIADYATQEQRLNAKIESAGAALRQTRLLLERSEIRAPFAGRVAKVHTAVGARPGRGAPLLDIFDPARLRLRVAIPQRYIAAFQSGGGVRAVLDAAGAAVTLTAAGLQPQVESGNSGVDAFFDLPAGDWVLGAVRDVVVELPPVNALRLPIDALYNDEYIYRVSGDSRAQALRCERRGLSRSGADVNVLLACPDFIAGDVIIANQLPNLLGGAKVTIVGAR